MGSGIGLQQNRMIRNGIDDNENAGCGNFAKATPRQEKRFVDQVIIEFIGAIDGVDLRLQPADSISRIVALTGNRLITCCGPNRYLEVRHNKGDRQSLRVQVNC